MHLILITSSPFQDNLVFINLKCRKINQIKSNIFIHISRKEEVIQRDLLSKIQRITHHRLNDASLDQIPSLEQIRIQNQQLQVQLQQLKINQQYLLKQLIIQAKIQSTLSSYVEKITQNMAFMYREDRQLEFAKPIKLFFKMIQGYRVDQLERIITFLILEMDVSTPISENYSPIQFPYY